VSTEDKMTIDERRKYLRTMKKRYQPANRTERGRLLDEMVAITSLDRKTLIRLMGGTLARKARLTQRGRSYGVEVDHALQVIAESLDYVCAERLTPALEWMAEHLSSHDELETSPELLEQLGQISVSTVRRRMERLKQDQRQLPRKGPERANQATRGVPMKRIAWDEPEPGHFETDLVHHGGPSTSGEYVHTLQMIDVATGWSERVALLGRSYRAMEDAFRRCLARLPFPVREIHPDNGCEFFNQHLLRFFHDTLVGVELSRSRPYHKNDNRNVEQKNSSLVRAYLGYERLDTVQQTHTLNLLYDKMWLYYNFFQPVMHLKEKVVSSQHGQPTHLKRHYDEAHTPFDRLCATQAIADPLRQQLNTLRAQTNPRQLRQDIYALIDRLFALPGAVPGTTQDVFHTLTSPITLLKGEDCPVTLSFDRTICPR
jgi:hypothetical protein